MTKYKKPTYIIIQEAMAERIRFLEDELYERAYKDIEKLEAQNDFLKGLCDNQRQDCQIISTTITMVSLSSGNSHEDIEEVEFEEIER